MVQEPTYHRTCNGAMQNPTLIDLILTNNRDKVNEIEHYPPLGKSHHSCVLFNAALAKTCCNMHKNVKLKYNFKKADYAQMKTLLKNTEWDILFEGHDDPDTVWEQVDNRIKHAMDLFIPPPKKAYKNIATHHAPLPPDLHSKI